MILVDTNVLVALADERDGLHARARSDLRKLKGPFGVTGVVLAETCFLLQSDHRRRRVRHLLEHLPMRAIELTQPWWDELFDWLARYAEHAPDLCDATLVLLAARQSLPIWTYDTEFHKRWRRPDGKPLRVVPSLRAGM